MDATTYKACGGVMSGVRMTCWSAMLGIASCVFWALYSAIARSQVTSDGTLPNNTMVTQQGNTFNITGGTQAERNLFHSFKEFSVPTGSTAIFNNATDIQNIFTRVTGGSVSHIDGLIQSNGKANLFFINPSGIVFGSNARVNIGGSFIGSTASHLKFTSGFEFSATNPLESPILTVSLPIGLQFGTNSGRIEVQGNGRNITTTETDAGLRVLPNRTLALVGGDVAIAFGTLKAAGGHIELGSVAGNGLVSLTPTNYGFSLGYGGVQNFGNIQQQQALIDASGEVGGTVRAIGKRIILTNGSVMKTSTFGTEPGGGINLNATESVEISGTDLDGQISSGLFTENQGAGNGGNILIRTTDLTVSNGARVSASSQGTGNGGDIAIDARSSRLENNAVLKTDSTSGNGGNIFIRALGLTVRNGAQISASSQGTGDGGNIYINARLTRLDDNAALKTESIRGKGGSITLFQHTLLLLSRDVNTELGGIGISGYINVTAQLILTPNSNVVSFTFKPVQIADTSGQIDTGCTPGSKQRASSFIITGRGSLPPSPYDMLRSEAILVDWITLNPGNGDRNRHLPSPMNTATVTPEPIVEATEWTFDNEGHVLLTARSSATRDSVLKSVACGSF